MSTQDGSGISFDISNEQQNLRLLELPPSLLALIVSKDPPNLWLKSAETPSDNVDFKQPGPSAVLCTNDHTYQLRQVQSSNSVYIVQPSETRRGDSEALSPGLSAIAQCTATLELIPSNTAASFAMISQLLKRSLPSYRGTETELELGANTTLSSKRQAPQDQPDGLFPFTSYLGNYKDENAILQDAPYSTEELNKTWKQLCAFEVFGRAWLPTPSALAMVWASILSAATVRGVNLEKRFDLKSIAEMVDNDGYPLALVMAVVTRLVCDTDYLKNDYVSLSMDKTVQWVGIVCLQRVGESEQANTKGISQSDFLAQWHDLLPEGWRKHASMDLLKAKYSHSDPSKEKTVFGEDIYDPTSLVSLSSASTGGKANRKWHEKFKMGRK